LRHYASKVELTDHSRLPIETATGDLNVDMCLHII
jgi:hypothetical protein